MRGQWLGVRRVTGPAGEVPGAATAPPHRLLLPLLTMPVLGEGTEDAVTPWRAAELAEVDRAEVVDRWRAEKQSHVCGSACGGLLVSALQTLGGVATLREVVLVARAGQQAYGTIRVCVEQRTVGVLWRRSGRSVLVAAPGVPSLLDAAVDLRGAVEDAGSQDAGGEQLRRLVDVYGLDELRELTSSRLTSLVRALGGCPSPRGDVPSPARSASRPLPVPHEPSLPPTRSLRPATTTEAASEETTRPAHGPDGRRAETLASPHPRVWLVSRPRTPAGDTTAAPPPEEAAPMQTGAVVSEAVRSTPSRVREPRQRAELPLPRSPFSGLADATAPQQQLRALVDEVLERRPWSSAAEVTTELRRVRGMDVPRGDVNVLLYGERGRYERHGETPPRWRLRPHELTPSEGVVGGASTAARAGGDISPHVAPSAPRSRGAASPAPRSARSTFATVEEVWRTPAPTRPAAKSSKVRDVGPQPPRIVPARPRPLEAHVLLALHGWRSAAHMGVVDGLAVVDRIALGAAAAVMTWRGGLSVTLLTPDPDMVEIWAQAVADAGVPPGQIHRAYPGQAPPSRTGLVCVTAPHQAVEHAVRAPRTDDDLVVVDELHRFVTGNALRVLDGSFTRRLGLVTTRHWYDPTPDLRVASYFQP